MWVDYVCIKMRPIFNFFSIYNEDYISGWRVCGISQLNLQTEKNVSETVHDIYYTMYYTRWQELFIEEKSYTNDLSHTSSNHVELTGNFAKGPIIQNKCIWYFMTPNTTRTANAYLYLTLYYCIYKGDLKPILKTF